MIQLCLSGSPYEMGYEHGRALRVLVDAMVRYESRRHTHVPAPSLDIEAVRARVNRVAPLLLEELQGIAAGSGLPFDLLLEVNFRVLHYCTLMVRPFLGRFAGIGAELGIDGRWETEQV